MPSCAWRARSATARSRPGSRWSCRRSIRRSACRCTRCSPTPCRWSTWRSCSVRPRPRRLHPLVFRWFQDPDLTMRFQAAAGAALQLGIVVLAIALWRALEALVAWLARPWLVHGGRGGPGGAPRFAAWARHGRSCSGARSAACSASRCGRSRGAGAFRTPCRSRGRSRAGRISWRALAGRRGPRWSSGSRRPAWRSRWSRAVSRTRAAASGARARARLPCFYMPLLVPQIGFLFGVQVLFLWLGLADGWLAVIWTTSCSSCPTCF